jgi:hypothetical protein
LGEGVDLLAGGLDLGLESIGLGLGVGHLVSRGWDRGGDCGADGSGGDDRGQEGSSPMPPIRR